MNFFKIIIILFISFFVASAFAQSKKDMKKVNKFDVKSMTETITEMEDGKEITYKDTYTAFDKNGNVIEKDEYHKDGSLKYKSFAKYDGKGNKLEDSYTETGGKKEEGKHKEKNVRHTYKYDVNNNKIEEIEMDNTGKVIYKMQISYNIKGDKTLENIFVDDKLSSKVVYSYDSKGLKTEKKELTSDGKLISSHKYTYQF